jgi:hypothetical protein
MLESCGSVEEAIAFYGSHKEPGFSVATMLVADRDGNVAVFGMKDGRLHVLKGKGCGIWGWRGAAASELILLNSSPVITNAARVLNGAKSQGKYGTNTRTFLTYEPVKSSSSTFQEQLQGPH